MSFDLCNAPATFMHCMTSVFTNMIEDRLDVFMDDFSVYRDSFTDCLANLEWVLVNEGIVLGHRISKELKVNQAKIEVIENSLQQRQSSGFKTFLGMQDSMFY